MRRDIWLAGVVGAVVGSWLTLVVLQLGEHGFSLPHRSSNAVADNRPTAAPAPAETAKADPAPPENTEASKPVDATKQENASGNAQPQEQAKAQPVTPPADTAPDRAAPSATAPASTNTPESGTQPSETASATPATPTPAADSAEKKPADDVAKTEKKAAADQPVLQQDKKPETDIAPSDSAATKPSDGQSAPDAAKSTQVAAADTPKPAGTMTDTSNSASTAPQPAPTEEAKTEPLPDNRRPADQIDRERAAAEHRTVPQAQPQSEQASLGPAQKPQEQVPSIELIRPFSDQAGIVTVAGKSVQLVGVIPTDVERMCTSDSGKVWPCGQAARTAFRMYLRGRTIDCDLPSTEWKGTVTGACRYVRVDLSAWLVRFGWADPEPGSPLAPLVEEAKEKKRGMYGEDPRKNGKSTLGPALPKEDPLNPI